MRPLPSPIAAIADLDILGDSLVPRVEACSRGGICWVVLRAKRVATEDRVRLGRALLAVCPGLQLSVHGDLEACRTLGAQGLHLPSRGFDVGAVRADLPEGLLGVSCHDRAEVDLAAQAGADYGFLSPFFSPSSKSSDRTLLGVQGFRNVTEATSLPLLALGGMGPGRIAEALDAGAVGVAVIGGLFLASDVEARARALLAEVEACLLRRGRGGLKG